ncbi:progonadoliberin-1 [Pseudophryne corroboree]|uniref:progonadoliberin-1 n=1 Tax=Pseudophryne corroboree TaxID=495146 RepID=UPI00308209F2
MNRMNRCTASTLLIGIVLLLSHHISDAQHWSFDNQPGGKRDTESLQDIYSEVPNEVSEPQRLECSIPQSRLSLTKGALMNWLERDNGRKKI